MRSVAALRAATCSGASALSMVSIPVSSNVRRSSSVNRYRKQDTSTPEALLHVCKTVVAQREPRLFAPSAAEPDHNIAATLAQVAPGLRCKGPPHPFSSLVVAP